MIYLCPELKITAKRLFTNMKKTHKRILIFTIILLSFSIKKQAFGQVQPLYSQYMFNGAVINPAYMSMDESYNLNAVYRNQWGGFEGAPKTGTISFTMPAFSSNTSLGIMALQDKVGVDEETGVNIMASQRVTITEESYLAVGVTGGFSYYRERDSQLEQEHDPLFQGDKTLKRSSIGIGVMYFSDRFFIGLSSPAFKKLTLADERADLQAVGHYYLSTGYLFDIDDDFKFKPTVLLKKTGNSNIQTELMASVLVKDVLWLGAGYRQKESVVGMLQVVLGSGMQLGYSYDHASRNLYKGSHEIALRYRFGRKGRDVSPRYF